jgi:lipoate-protein ligase B
MTGLAIEWLDRVPYADALELQARAVDARRCGSVGDRLLLLEHPPVVTLGSSSREQNLLVGERELARRGVELHRVRRGGDVTYHAPGQLVGYLIMDLAARCSPDVQLFLRAIEQALIDGLDGLGLPARRIDGMTGVFVQPARGGTGADRPRKIASIGVAVRHWVTYHGFALNVSPDLAGFDVIVPCGLENVEMTSLARELAAGASEHAELGERARWHIAEAFRATFADYPAPHAAL